MVVLAVAQRPGEHADQHDDLDPEPHQEHREQDHEDDLAHLPEGLDERRLRRTDLVQEGIRERVVELQWDAEQERAQREDQEIAMPEQLQRVESERITHAERTPGGLRRCGRQREGKQTERDRRARRDLHRQCLRVRLQHLPHHHPRDDPADGAEHADERELPGRILDVVERDRVRQRQRGHVADRIDDQQGIERGERLLRRHEPEHRASRQMQDGKELLGREESVGDHADEERRDQCRDRRRAVREADLLSRELERLSEIRPHRDEPHPPDEVLEEHHHREPGLDHRCSSRMRMLRNQTTSMMSPPPEARVSSLVAASKRQPLGSESIL